MGAGGVSAQDWSSSVRVGVHLGYLKKSSRQKKMKVKTKSFKILIGTVLSFLAVCQEDYKVLTELMQGDCTRPNLGEDKAKIKTNKRSP